MGGRYHLGVRVLFVCTANVCRSPMAAALFAGHARRRGARAEVSSAGTDAGGPSMPDAAPPEVIDVMESRGVDLRAHRARALTTDALRGAELVIGMSRRHVQESVVLEPSCFARAFTLTEVVQRATALGVRREDLGLGAWIEAVHGDRTRPALAARSAAGDIADPYGGPMAGYRHAALELDELTGRLAALVWPVPVS